MTADFSVRSRAVFDAALDLPEPEREAYVRATCADEPEIMRNVLELLGFHDRNRDRKTQQAFSAMLDAVTSEQSQLAGRVLGRYELIELIGQGGMGRVYKARRTDAIGQTLALKLIRQEFVGPNLLDRFAAEREILARLNHPNIAHFIDAGSIDADTHFVAMELVDGLPLRSYLAKHPLTLDERLNLFRQLLAAVAHAHRSLVIHRDIKPENVMIRPDGVLKLLDFGIAKLIGDQPTVTKTAERMFTPLNAAPEQILGQPCDVTTDIYALGALLYEWVSGAPVFPSQGRTPGELEHDVLKVPPSPMRQRCNASGLPPASIPADLENIVQKALRKEPDGRYRTVEQFDADIANLLANQPVSVSGNSTWYRTRKLVARHRLATALSVAIAITILAALVVVVIQNRRVSAERDRATLALDAIRNAFLSADPDGYTGGDIRARQILRQTNSALSPLIRADDLQTADLLLTLVEVQVSMGMLTDAESTLSKLPAALAALPRACVLQSRLAVEQEHKAQAEQILARCAPLDPTSRVQADIIRARLATKREQHSRAADLYAQISREQGIDEPVWLFAQTQLSIQLAKDGQTEAAMQALDRAESVATGRFPSDHPVLSRLKLARLESLAAAGAQARLIQEGPAICASLREVLGQDSILMGRAESLVGQALLQDSQYESAVPHLRNAWETMSQVLGDEHSFSLSSELNLANALAGPNGNGAEAGPHFAHIRKAIADLKSQAFRPFAHMAQAKWLVRQGRFEDTYAALNILSDPGSQVELLEPSFQEEWRNWQVFGFWSADCANASGDYSLQNLCELSPADVESCQNTHRSLCPSQPLPDSGTESVR